MPSTFISPNRLVAFSMLRFLSRFYPLVLPRLRVICMISPSPLCAFFTPPLW